VAELGKDEHLLLHHGNGIIGTDLGTLTAVGTLILIYSGDKNGYGFTPGDFGFQKHVVIRLLDVAV
jgi:hypothetical protein